MMQIHDPFLDPTLSLARIDLDILLSRTATQPMQPQQIAIARLHDVLFAVVPPELAQLGEV